MKHLFQSKALLFLLVSSLFFFSQCQKEPNVVLNPPIANFSASNTTIYKSQSITFNDLSSQDASSWYWEFEGGNPANSNLRSPGAITYSTPGVYKVSLIASNADGADTETKTGYITILDANVQTLLNNNVGIPNILTIYPLDSLYGKFYQGGLIFYYNTATSFGLVAADVDQSVSCAWGCSGADLSGFNCSGSSLGGYTLNGTIACLGASSAWGLCDYLLYNNYSDWHLPSALTLVYMYQNLHLKGFGNFSPNSYWSYCETNDYNSKSVSFFNGQIADYQSKNNYLRVRAVRYI